MATFLFHHFLEEEDLRWLRSLTAEKLSDEEARALVFVREAGAIDNAAYREINRTDTLQSSVHLRRLRDLGLLEMKGSGSRTYYVPGAGFVDVDAADLAQSSTDLAQSSTDLAQSTDADFSALPQDLQQRLSALGARPRKEIVRELIVELCALAPRSASELASLLGGRDPKNLVSLHLRPMKEEGILSYLRCRRIRAPECTRARG